jgi:N utilization substance protein A
MSAELILALEQLEKEKGIKKEIIIEAIEAALISAYKKNFGSAMNVKVNIDRVTGDVKVFALRKVAENPDVEAMDISVGEAAKLNPTLEIGDYVELEVTPRSFGRIAAQTAKQVVVQKLREAERGIISMSFIIRKATL